MLENARHPSAPMKMMMTVPAIRTVMAGLWLWTGLGATLHAAANEGPPPTGQILATLTDAERAWLRDHRVITVAHDPEWAPVEFSDERGELTGMSGDYLDLVEERLGVEFKRIPNLSWQEVYARQQRWEIDMATCVAETPERTFWAFTKPYLSIPIVIATQSDVPYIGDMKELFGKKVALVKGYAIDDWVTRDFPEINLVRVNTVSQGLAALQRGEVLAYLDNLLIIGDYQAKLKVANIKIAGQTPYVNAQRMAVRKDWAPLAGILDKALDSIPAAERREIYQKWVPVHYEHGFDYTLLGKALVGFAVVLGASFLWIWKLAREIKQRQRAEAALGERKGRLRAIIEQAPFGAHSYELQAEDRLVLTAANRSADRILGIDHSPLMGRSIEEAFPGLRGTVIPDVYRRLAATEGNFEDEQVAYEQGEIRGAFAIHAFHTGANRMTVFFLDILERKRAEEALKEKTEELDRFFSTTLDLLCVADTDGCFRRLNPQWEAVLGYPLAELEGTRFLDLVHPEDLEATVQAISRLDAQQPVLNFVNRYRCKDGSYRWVEWRSSPWDKMVYAAARDITERKRLELESEAALALFEASIAQSPSGILVASAPDVTIRWANPAALDIRGRTDQPLTGIEVSRHASHWQTFRPDGTPYPSEELPLSRAVVKAEVTRDEEVIIRNAQGEDRWVSVNAAPIRDRAGQVTAGIVVFHDITGRKRAEAEREKLQSQLTQAQKMESVGRLAGGVAHDFNNMLQVILGNVSLALQDLPPESPVRDSLLEAQKSAQRSADLTRQLLAFARKQTIQPITLDLNDTVAGMLKMLRRLIGEAIDLAWMPGANLWFVKMDPSQIDQVLANLCVNARDAIEGVGTVNIETTNVTLDDTYVATHPEVVAGDYVLLAVSDTGKGMDAETRAHLFEPFFTTKEQGSGTGLGLATVFGIVKQNHGLISVYSEPGQGTTFKVYLPRAETQAPAAVAAARKRDLCGTETVLLVEDENQILGLAQRILQQHGYTVLAARSPGAALKLASEYAATIHLLITDVVMPDMNGRQLYDRLAALKPELRCLYMSGYTADVIAHHGVLDEGVHFLQKPFTIESLAEGVREALQPPIAS